MTNFVYISPGFPAISVGFCDRLHRAGVRVLGVGDTSYDELDPRLRASLTEYFRVESLEDYDQVYRAVGYLAWKHGRIDWVESHNEHWLWLDAMLRDDFHVTTGHGTAIIESIKSKAAMKPVYAAAGIPSARQAPVTDADAAVAFAAAVGYPLVAKPQFGVGANATFRLADEAAVRGWLATPPSVPYVIEEYVYGDIFSFDALVDAAGEPVFEAACSFPPSIIDLVQLKLDTVYRVEAFIPPALAELGRRTVSAFGVFNRFVHLEFFRLTTAKPGLGAVGDFVALEVNMRPAGGDTLDMYNHARSADVYQAYADLVTGADSGAASALRRDPQYAVYASRRDEFTYATPWTEIRAQYADLERQFRRNPPIFAPQMGDEYMVIRTPDLATAERFAAEVTHRS